MDKGATRLVIEDSLIGTVLGIVLIYDVFRHLVTQQRLAAHSCQTRRNRNGGCLMLVEGFSADLLERGGKLNLRQRHIFKGTGTNLLHTLFHLHRVDELVAAESRLMHLLDAGRNDDIAHFLISDVKARLVRLV